MRFKTDWASLIVGSKFLRAIFQVQALRGAYIWRGDLTEGFLRYRFGGLIHGGAYFRNFPAFDSKDIRDHIFSKKESRIMRRSQIL